MYNIIKLKLSIFFGVAMCSNWKSPEYAIGKFFLLNMYDFTNICFVHKVFQQVFNFKFTHKIHFFCIKQSLISFDFFLILSGSND